MFAHRTIRWVRLCVVALVMLWYVLICRISSLSLSVHSNIENVGISPLSLSVHSNMKMLEGKRIAHQELQLLNFKTLDISRYTLRVTGKSFVRDSRNWKCDWCRLAPNASKTPNET